MALIFEKVSLDNRINNLSYSFMHGFITVIEGDNGNLLVDILTGKTNYEGKVYNDLNPDYNLVYIKNSDFLYTLNVRDELILMNKSSGISLSELNDRIEKYINLFGLDVEFLDRKCNSLSKTEAHIVNIIKKLISNFDVVIFDKVFSYFDYKYGKILKQLINSLKVVGKVVIIIDDINVVYTFANRMLILNYDGTSYSGDVTTICTNVELLQSFSIKPPLLSLITYKVKTKKDIKISYHKDVRDLIKDVYKHV